MRLRVEGLALALCGATGTIVLLASTAPAARNPLSTIGQLVVVALLLAWLGPRSVRRAIAASEPRAASEVGSGEPTPVWSLPLIVVALAGAAGLLAGWDAAVRVTGGCVLVGLAQSLLLEPIVAADERRSGRTYFRVAGSRILRGTRLGYLPGSAASAVSTTLAPDPATSSTPPSRRRDAPAATNPAKRSAVAERAACATRVSGALARPR